MHWIFAHLIGDFLLQNDYLAENKKKNSLVCLLHVCFYIIPFIIFCSFNWLQLLLIAAEHYIQDRTNIVYQFMIITGRKNFASKPFTPWSIFLIDGIFHILFILLITKINIL